MNKVANTKTELLQVIAESGCGDPYNMVSGIVRGVTVDRWCDELVSDGFITGDPDKPHVECTARGRRWLRAYRWVKS